MYFYTYQNLEQNNVGVDIVKMESTIFHVEFTDVLHREYEENLQKQMTP